MLKVSPDLNAACGGAEDLVAEQESLFDGFAGDLAGGAVWVYAYFVKCFFQTCKAVAVFYHPGK